VAHKAAHEGEGVERQLIASRLDVSDQGCSDRDWRAEEPGAIEVFTRRV
jgi:hypothetical protein